MKLCTIFTTLVASCAASDSLLWAEFKKSHEKNYKNLVEEKHRYSIFESNLRTIEKHNAKFDEGIESYYLNVNQFADLTDEEFRAIYLNYNKPEVRSNKTFELPEGAFVPDTIDWREKGAVLRVKNQGHCGSCWAFSAIGSLEGQNAIIHGINESLSEEELVDCSQENYACHGGTMQKAFSYVKRNGISTEESYPYTASNGILGSCKTGKDSGIKITAYTYIPGNEEALRQAVGTVGPISIGINGIDIKLYGGGIFNNPNCEAILNHGVLAVGYGSKDGLDYWIVKNSWGDTWGEHGYILMSRNKKHQCAIGMDNCYPNLE